MQIRERILEFESQRLGCVRDAAGKFILPVACEDNHHTMTMGCGQVVRHQVLVLVFGGSNPSIPAKMCANRDLNGLHLSKKIKLHF